jgi:hypothetical protein
MAGKEWQKSGERKKAKKEVWRISALSCWENSTSHMTTIFCSCSN